MINYWGRIQGDRELRGLQEEVEKMPKMKSKCTSLQSTFSKFSDAARLLTLHRETCRLTTPPFIKSWIRPC